MMLESKFNFIIRITEIFMQYLNDKRTTLCRMLLNWAVRAGRLPIFVDLDVSQNCISLPGTISAVVAERTASVEEGFNIDSQISYHFGYKTPAENPVLYRRLISVLKDTINFRSEQIQASKDFI